MQAPLSTTVKKLLYIKYPLSKVIREYRRGLGCPRDLQIKQVGKIFDNIRHGEKDH